MPSVVITPELQPGDHLSRAEFERRYDMMPRSKKAELIQGVVYVDGAPELVVEVAASSVSHDLHEKLRAYRRNGVLEYLVWRVQDGAFDWFRLVDGEFQRADEFGIVTSSVFPGLELDVEALLAGRLDAVLDSVRRACDTAAHAEFVTTLRG